MSGQNIKGRGREMRGMKVREIIEAIGRREPPIISDDATIQEVVESMCNCQHSRVIYVVDKDNELLGTIPLGTLMRHIFGHSHERHAHPRHLLGIITAESARDLMNKRAIHAREQEDVEVVLERMVGKRVSEIAIVDDEGKIIADLTMLDMLKVCQ